MMAPVIVGFSGLGAETAYWYYRQRDLQAAADIAAFTGAVVKREGATAASITSSATADAASSGWKPALGTIAVNNPPTSGANISANAVEVILTETQPRFFSAIYNPTPITFTVRSVATIAPTSPACILGLNKTASGTVEFWGSAGAALNNCNILSNSLASDSFKLGGSASVTVPCVSAAGGAAVSATLNLTSCPSVNTNQPQGVDPYKDVPAPPIPASCSSVPGGPSVTLSPGKYKGLSLSGSGSVTFQPGIYVIDGSATGAGCGGGGSAFSITGNKHIIGTGVMFYLTGGATLSFNGTAELDLTAMTTGDYKGLLFYGDRTQPTANNTFNGNNSSTMTGAVYFPSQKINFSGNFSSNSGCMQVIGDIINYTGSGAFNTTCTGTGMNTIQTPGTIAWVE
jgi:hypothetical protein